MVEDKKNIKDTSSEEQPLEEQTSVEETAEEAQAGGVPTVLSYSAFAQIYGAARRLNNLIQELE